MIAVDRIDAVRKYHSSSCWQMMDRISRDVALVAGSLYYYFLGLPIHLVEMLRYTHAHAKPPRGMQPLFRRIFAHTTQLNTQL